MSLISSPSGACKTTRFQQIALAAFFACEALVFLALGIALGWIGIARPHASAPPESDGFHVFAILLSLFFLPAAALTGSSAWGLHRRRDWAITAGHIACITQAIAFPVGTIIALYGFWVLSRTAFSETKPSCPPPAQLDVAQPGCTTAATDGRVTCTTSSTERGRLTAR